MKHNTRCQLPLKVQRRDVSQGTVSKAVSSRMRVRKVITADFIWLFPKPIKVDTTSNKVVIVRCPRTSDQGPSSSFLTFFLHKNFCSHTNSLTHLELGEPSESRHTNKETNPIQPTNHPASLCSLKKPFWTFNARTHIQAIRVNISFSVRLQ